MSQSKKVAKGKAKPKKSRPQALGDDALSQVAGGFKPGKETPVKTSK